MAVNRLKKINLRMRPLFRFLGITLKGFRGIPTALPLVTRLAPKERQSKRGDDQMRVMKAFLPVLLVLASATAAEAQAQVKFGFINSQIIIEQDSAAQAAQRQFDADVARYQAEITQFVGGGPAASCRNISSSRPCFRRRPGRTGKRRSARSRLQFDQRTAWSWISRLASAGRSCFSRSWIVSTVPSRPFGPRAATRRSSTSPGRASLHRIRLPWI